MSDQNDPKKGSAPGSLDRATQLAQDRTDLAIERNSMALERTLMAWIRTSLSMIGFGFTLAKFFEYLSKDHNIIIKGPLGWEWSPGLVGLTLVVIGVFALIVAALQYRQNVHLLRREGLQKRWSLALTVAVLLGLLGILAFLGLVLNK